MTQVGREHVTQYIRLVHTDTVCICATEADRVCEELIFFELLLQQYLSVLVQYANGQIITANRNDQVQGKHIMLCCHCTSRR